MAQIADIKALTQIVQAHREEYRAELARIKQEHGPFNPKDIPTYSRLVYRAKLAIKNKYLEEFTLYKKEAIAAGFPINYPNITRLPRIKTITIKTREDVDLGKLYKAIAKVISDFELRTK
jgi:hypothetical protein